MIRISNIGPRVLLQGPKKGVRVFSSTTLLSQKEQSNAAEEHNTITEVIEEIKNRKQTPKTESANHLLNPVFLDKQIVFSDKTPTWTRFMDRDDSGAEGAQSNHSSFSFTDKDFRSLPISATSYQTMQVSGLEKAIHLVEEKEKLKVALEHALAPHIQHLKETLNSDKDVLDQCMTYLDQYLKRDVKRETHTKRFIEIIQKRSFENPSFLPQPYSITLPAIIHYIFDSGTFQLPGDRNYTILKSIYHRCKNCKDLSLYLNVCNVDFYNLLLKYTWQEYKDLSMVSSLVHEMDANGIRGDITTTEVLENITKQVEYITDGIKDDVLESEQSEGMEGFGVMWCAENVLAIERLTRYLRTLKRSMMS